MWFHFVNLKSIFIYFVPALENRIICKFQIKWKKWSLSSILFLKWCLQALKVFQNYLHTEKLQNMKIWSTITTSDKCFGLKSIDKCNNRLYSFFFIGNLFFISLRIFLIIFFVPQIYLQKERSVNQRLFPSDWALRTVCFIRNIFSSFLYKLWSMEIDENLKLRLYWSPSYQF